MESRLHHDPAGLELVREISPDTLVENLIDFSASRFFGGMNNMPKDILESMRSRGPEWVAPFLALMRPGDSLWMCRSEQRGPLFGNEGVAIVRAGRPTVYLRCVNY